MSDNCILVPVSQSPGLRETVGHAVQAALEGGSGRIQFVFVHPSDMTDQHGAGGEAIRQEKETAAADLLDRVTVWAEEDAGDTADELTIGTAQLGVDRYIFSPEEVAQLLVDHAESIGCDRLVLDPDYDPGIGAPLLQPLEFEIERLSEIDIEEATTTRPARRAPLLVKSSALRVGALFGISFLFYQMLAGTISVFDIVTGAVSATIVAVGLSRVTFSADPTRYTPIRLVRMAIYTPYLLIEILKSNVVVAAVILHPRLPIEPRLTRIRPAVWGGLPLTTLANSITLTPGTLTVRIRGEWLTVHTLIPSAKEDLFDGGLERAVRFVFYGRDAANIPSLRERGQAETLQSPEESESSADSETATPEKGRPDRTGGDGQ